MKENKLGASKILLVALCFMSFLLYGVYFNCFGANTTVIMSFFGISESGNGAILTVQAVGCIILAVFLGLNGERINKISGIAAGLLILGAASLLIGLIPRLAPSGGYPLMLGFSLLAGVGYITIDLLMNGVIADVFPRRKNTFLPYVHAFYGIGAMLAPLFVTLLVRPDAPESFALPYLVVGIVSILACGLIVLAGRRVLPETPYADMSEIRSRAKGNPAEIFRDKRAWLYLITCFLYQTFQTGMTTWFPVYCANRLEYSFESAAFMVTLYFLGALAMRFLSPVVYRKISVRSFYVASLLVSGALFFLFLLLSPSPAVARVIIVVMGLLQGASIPALVILCCETFPERTASASSVIVFASALATLIVPAAIGQLIQSAGYLLPMLIITACLFLSVLTISIVKRSDAA